MFALGRQICFMRLFRRVKPTYERRHAVGADARAPSFAASKFRNTKQAARLVSVMRAFLILNVARCGHIPKVVKRIVSRVAVNVIDITSRPIAGHVEPSQSICSVAPFVDPHYQVAFWISVACQRAGNNLTARFYTPSKCAGFRAIVQQCTQLIVSDVERRHVVSLA